MEKTRIATSPQAKLKTPEEMNARELGELMAEQLDKLGGKNANNETIKKVNSVVRSIGDVLEQAESKLANAKKHKRAPGEIHSLERDNKP